MTALVKSSTRDGVAYLVVNHPPVNALSHAVRVGLLEAVEAAEANASVSVIVLAGQGTTFPAGAELQEYDHGVQAPFLRDVCERVEQCDKPVIAALHGTVLGGGLELALAAHYRIARRGTRMGLPEIKLALPPSAGGTQRLPRLLGAEAALDLMLSGRTVAADRPPGQLLLDALVDGDVLEGAARFAAKLIAMGDDPRRLSADRSQFADMAAYQAAVSEAREGVAQDNPVAQEIVHLVEAAPLLPFDAALSMEEEAFTDSLKGDRSKALRHLLLAERLARRFDLPAGTQLPKIERIAVLGGGALALQIALTALNAGLRVNWGTREAEPREAGLQQIRAVFDKGVKSGGLDQTVADRRLANLTIGDSAEMVTEADIILHCARGQGDVPAPAHIPRAVTIAGRVEELGLRFAPPAFATRLLEIICGPGIRPEQTAAALALGDALGRVPVQVFSTGDSLAGRLELAFHRAADGLLDAGADPYVIDSALRDWGWARAPFEQRDVAGLADFAQITGSEEGRNWSAQLLEAGRPGRKSGAGFYAWSADGPSRDPAVIDLLNNARGKRDWSPDQIVGLILGALCNEALRALQAEDQANDLVWRPIPLTPRIVQQIDHRRIT
ncbi:MAG: enoyl-CoA hydratase-related protein [Paracoccaceae bacterium]|nr:enoyl-CoA hydratase-related protein [Paracoccaceae bacterium]